MGQATIEVKVPMDESGYDAPMLFSADTGNNSISGGSATTSMFTFSWISTGFNNSTWWGTNTPGPTFGHASEIENGTVSIDDLFQAWQLKLSGMEDFEEAYKELDNFIKELNSNTSGCVSFSR